MRFGTYPRVLVAAILAAASGCGTAAAQDAAALPGADTLAAVGWLGWGDAPDRGTGGRSAGCTGVLVAADAVLTAAHCVTRDERTAPEHPGGILFAAGWRDGRATALRHARAVVLPAPRALLGGAIPYDLALVVLDAPVGDVAPLGLAGADAVAGRAVIVGYAHVAPAAAKVVGCAVLGEAGGVVALDCAAQPGFSGGPVLLPTAAGWQVAGIVVARGRGADATGAYAVTVPEDIRAAIAAQ